MCFNPVPVLCSLKRDESGFLGALPASPAADDMQTEEKVVESPPHSRHLAAGSRVSLVAYGPSPQLPSASGTLGGSLRVTLALTAYGMSFPLSVCGGSCANGSHRGRGSALGQAQGQTPGPARREGHLCRKARAVRRLPATQSHQRRPGARGSGPLGTVGGVTTLNIPPGRLSAP